MKWIDTLERKFGRYAIHGLIRIVVAFNALVFVLSLMNPRFLELLYLSPRLIMQGEVWRLVTYIFIPSRGGWWLMPNYLWLAFLLMFVWMLGDALEGVWGAFKLNIYYFLGMLCMTISAFVFGSDSSSRLLNMSLLFAFATIEPDYPVFLIIFPVKVKWLALFYVALLFLDFLGGSFSLRMGILATFGSYLIFFGPDILRMARHRADVAQRRQRFEKAAQRDDEAMHRCTTCDRTEISNPELDFRVSADGNEYCTEHLPAKKI